MTNDRAVRNNVGRLVGLLLLLPLCGCFSFQKQALRKDDMPVDEVKLPLVLMGVKVHDGRAGVETRPTKRDALQPALTDAQAKRIENEVARYFAGGRQVVIVDAELRKGIESFKGSPARAHEQSDVEIRLTFHDAIGRRPLFWSKGSATLTIDAMTASATSSNALFEKTVRRAIYEAMREAKERFVSP